MGAKTITLINNSRNPIVTKDSEGKTVKVMRGDTVTVLEPIGAKLLRFYGVTDLSKYVKPTSEMEKLAEENVALKAELAKARATKKNTPLED